VYLLEKKILSIVAGGVGRSAAKRKNGKEFGAGHAKEEVSHGAKDLKTGSVSRLVHVEQVEEVKIIERKGSWKRGRSNERLRSLQVG